MVCWFRVEGLGTLSPPFTGNHPLPWRYGVAVQLPCSPGLGTLFPPGLHMSSSWPRRSEPHLCFKDKTAFDKYAHF